MCARGRAGVRATRRPRRGGSRCTGAGRKPPGSAAREAARLREGARWHPLIYAEVSAGYETIELLEEVLPAGVFRRDALPYEAAFLAGKAFLRYRRRGDSRTTPLPDFYIGAHAAVAGLRLLTRDAVRYRIYFPKLALIAPR